jgi:hypothetical protein
MRRIKGFNTNRNVNFIEPLKNLIRNLYIESDEIIGNIYTFKSKSKFPPVGEEGCLYIDLSDNMQVYQYVEGYGYSIFNNNLDILQG